MVNELFTNKKSNINFVLMILIQVSIVLAVYLILNSYLSKLENNTFFEKDYMIKDISLMTDAVYASPGEIHYVYSNDKIGNLKLNGLSRYTFKFKDSRILLGEREDNNVVEFSYPYADDKSLPISGAADSSNGKLEFYKNENKFEIN